MRTVDFSPLYRSTIGFDRMFSMLDNLGSPDSTQTYPPYNIEATGENTYRIVMAVAGFGKDDISIEARENTLTIKSDLDGRDSEDNTEVLFKGIAKRSFERRFQLADHVEVRSASLENGLLNIELVREIPEAMKARKITINGSARLVENKTKK